MERTIGNDCTLLATRMVRRSSRNFHVRGGRPSPAELGCTVPVVPKRATVRSDEAGNRTI